MHLKTNALFAATAVIAAVNEPCIGSGGRAGTLPALPALPPQSRVLNLTRCLPLFHQLQLSRRRDHLRGLPRRCGRHQVLHQGVMRQHQRG
jgi:hypothetical protein